MNVYINLSGNQFIEITLEITLALVEYLAGLRGDSLLFGRKYTLIINADNDFYSQRDTLTRMGLSPRMSNLGSLPENAHTGLPIKSVKKTGLGSSAALVTSVVAAVLSHFNVISSSINEQEKALIHNIAQYCHCLAQGDL
jgi:phosphomevalonate kinase